MTQRTMEYKWVRNSHPEFQDELSQRMMRQWNEGLQKLFHERLEHMRKRDAELIQQLVDAVLYIYWTKPEAAKAKMNEVLKSAAAAGFKPSEP